MTNFYIFASVIIVSLISFVGVLYLALKMEKLKKIIFFLVSFSAGSLLGGAFFHLLPEIVEETGGFSIKLSLLIMTGILFFFVLEKFICWRHCHIPTSSDHPHHLAAMNLVGDGFHNLIDGMVIAASYLVSIEIGIATTFAVILHEIPQEIGDFGVLIHAGLSRAKALMFNFLSALTSVIGAGLAIFFYNYIENFTQIIIPLTIGGFIYIATADLIPELKKEDSFLSSLKQFAGLILGIGIMSAFLFME